MKFGHLKKALVAALPKQEPIAPQKRQPRPIQDTARERVEEGVIKFKPIDKQSSKVFWKAGFLERPPTVQAQPQPQPQPQIKTKQRKEITVQQITTHVVEGYGELVQVTDKTGMVLDLMKTRVEAAKTMLAEVDQFSQALDIAIAEWNTKLAQIGPSLGSAIGTVRQARQSAVTESATLLVSLRDIRAFFLGADHEQEVKRLREFIELCERLKALKADGTLDAVTDVVLKLA